MAAAGPVFSLVLAFVFWIIFKSTALLYVQAICFYLAKLNLILGLFNLAPGYPLDGGRILRAVLWHWYKDIKKATWYAAYSGRVIAILLIVVGIGGMFLGLGTLWFALLGFFLYFLAGMSYEQIILKEVLLKVKVKEVMKKEFVSVNEKTNLAELLSRQVVLGDDAMGTMLYQYGVFLNCCFDELNFLQYTAIILLA